MEKPQRLDELRLVRRAQGGNRKAFGDLVKHFMKPIYDLSYRMTGNHADADEVSQLTFVRAYTRLDSFEPGTSFRSWLLTIAANLSRDLHRKKAVRREVAVRDDDAYLRAKGKSPLDEVLDDEKEILVREALAAMPGDLRSVLVLHAMEDVPLADIARMTGTPEGTIRWRFFEARRRLREKLAGTPLRLASDAEEE
jgi:RNA polymerase sigma-70 factor (ECF subfamily)